MNKMRKLINKIQNVNVVVSILAITIGAIGYIWSDNSIYPNVLWTGILFLMIGLFVFNLIKEHDRHYNNKDESS